MVPFLSNPDFRTAHSRLMLYITHARTAPCMNPLIVRNESDNPFCSLTLQFTHFNVTSFGLIGSKGI